eukprot:3522989-Amphidinium_carterae.1
MEEENSKVTFLHVLDKQVQHTTDSRSPWQNGRTERVGAECKHLIYKTIEESVPTTAQKLEALIYVIAGVRNRHNMAAGFSPNQKAFGIERGIPDSFICPAHRSARIHEDPATRAWAPWTIVIVFCVPVERSIAPQWQRCGLVNMCTCGVSQILEGDHGEDQDKVLHCTLQEVM